jgi:RNA polymerase sigma-70 factor (ECF subfamily)
MSDTPERVPKLSKEEKDRRFQAELLPVLDSLYNFAFRLTLDEDDANDLVQETYLKAYRFFEYFEPGTNAKAWLFRILKNSFINDFRKKSKQPAKVDYSEIEGYYNTEEVDAEGDTGSTSPDLRQQATRDLIGDEVASALNSLPVDFRTVIILCDLEGFTYEEMAKVLDIPIGTVRSRLHRARNFLKEKLERYANKMGYGNDSDSDDVAGAEDDEDDI